MTDIDGSSTYSSVLLLQTSIAGSFSIYPTLVTNNTINIETSKAINHSRVIVFDMDGKKVAEQVLQAVQGRQSIMLNSAIKSASYIISITDGTILLAKQMIIVQ